VNRFESKTKMLVFNWRESVAGRTLKKAEPMAAGSNGGIGEGE
jgi:hypothetical protein